MMTMRFAHILKFSVTDVTQEVDVRALHHRREINKKTRSGDNKLRKQLKSAKKVKECCIHGPLLTYFTEKI